MGSKYVLTHTKADFDAISSAWAAMKLHKCDGILITTEPEGNVLSYLRSVYGELPEEIIKVKEDDLSFFKDIDAIYITDCMQVKRLGILGSLLSKAKRIIVYDHHLNHKIEIISSEIFLKERGSCTTIVVEKIIESKLKIDSKDATLYLLGIYEDTGMLTFSGTTSKDALVVSHLISVGGDVSLINNYVKRVFTREQVFVLNELLMNLISMKIGEHVISYSFASIDDYLPELAPLTLRMMDMEGLEVLFNIVRNGNTISIVGRSKNSKIDVSKVVEKFGGGGHPYAAAANVKDLELHEVVDLLRTVVREQVKPVKFLKELMNSPVKYLEVDSTIQEALDFTLVHNLNHMPVLDGGKTVGILSRKDILQGIKHGLGLESIALLMQVEFDVFTPDSPFSEAENAMICNGQKLIPIEENGLLVGVVTRTDVLQLIQEENIVRSSYEEGAKARLGLSRTRSLNEVMQTKLPPDQYLKLREIGEIAVDDGVAAYVVGGFVRDLLMGLSNVDMDIVIEGNATVIAVSYARLKAAKVTVHNYYKTATVHLDSGDKIDFATARTEFYCTPGAVPEMDFSSLRNDLMRRDFTINAMAIRLDGDKFGTLIDYFGGQRDILDKKIRVLHSLSFIDDPTRAFRAVRFASRFGFKLGVHTERLMKHAEELGLYLKIGGSKLFIEVKYILLESTYMQSIALLKKYRMLQFIAINLRIDSSKYAQFEFLENFYSACIDHLLGKVDLWKIRLTVLLINYTYRELKGILNNLNAERAVIDEILCIYTKSRFVAKKIKSMKAPKPSELYFMFSKLSNEELIMTGVLLKDRSYIIREYLENHKNNKPHLDGNDLKMMGIKPSPQMGQILKELLYAKLDGSIITREQEEEYVRNNYII